MIIVETENGHIYIGHDNGCFDLVVQHYGHTATYRIASPELTPPRFRDLFGGVDTFGPTAAQISLGFKIEDAGPKCDAYTPKLPYIQHTVSRNRIVGSVMDVDKYGNATTNIMEEDLEQAGIRISQVCNMQLDNHPKKLEIPFKRTYGNVSKGEPVLLLYEGMVQLALNEDSFAAKHEVKRGTAVEISR